MLSTCCVLSTARRFMLKSMLLWSNLTIYITSLVIPITSPIVQSSLRYTPKLAANIISRVNNISRRTNRHIFSRGARDDAITLLHHTAVHPLSLKRWQLASLLAQDCRLRLQTRFARGLGGALGGLNRERRERWQQWYRRLDGRLGERRRGTGCKRKRRKLVHLNMHHLL